MLNLIGHISDGLEMLKTLLLGLTLTLASTLFAQQQQVAFRKLTVQDGLSQNSVVAIAQDSLGFLWFATQDGLNRYDGQKFKRYNKSFDDITRATYSRLGKLMVDSHGALWLIPKSGILERVDLHNDKVESYPELKQVSSIFEDQRGRYWVGTWGNGLHQFDPQHRRFTKIDFTPITFDSVFQCYEDNLGKLWVATNRQLLALDVYANTWQQYTFDSSTQPLHFSSLEQDEKGTIWAGTFGSGLFYLNQGDEKFSPFRGKEDFPNELNIQSILVDSRNRIWLGTYGSGAYLIEADRNGFVHYQPEKHNLDAISYNDILTILEDRSGTVWLGTDGGGVSFYDENLRKFNVFTNAQMPENIHIDVIRSITVDSENSVWLGTSGKGLTRYNPEHPERPWQTFTTSSSGLPSNRIMSLLEPANGNLWVGTQGKGLNIFRMGTSDFISPHKSVGQSDSWPDHTIWSMYRGSENQYWVGTQSKGLFQLNEDAGLVAHYSLSDGLSSNNIRVITEGEKGVIWVGTDDQGLNRLDRGTKQFTTYQATDGKNTLSHNRIKCLYYSNKVLWIG